MNKTIDWNSVLFDFKNGQSYTAVNDCIVFGSGIGDAVYTINENTVYYQNGYRTIEFHLHAGDIISINKSMSAAGLSQLKVYNYL